MGRAIVNKETIAKYAKEVMLLLEEEVITSEMALKLINTRFNEELYYNVKVGEMIIPWERTNIICYSYDPATDTLIQITQ
jgi:hypothetical protein